MSISSCSSEASRFIGVYDANLSETIYMAVCKASTVSPQLHKRVFIVCFDAGSVSVSSVGDHKYGNYQRSRDEAIKKRHRSNTARRVT